MKNTSGKKCNRFALAAICTAVLSGVVAFGVACGGKKPTATLTFIEGVDGETTRTTRTVAVGETLGSALSGMTPAPVESLEFGGWYAESAPADEKTVITAEGLTLTAKYRATYTVSQYLQRQDGSYGDADVSSGKSWYGEPFTYAYSVPVHYSLGEKPEGEGYAESKVSTESLGKNETFTVYFARDRVTATYHFNPPADSGAADREVAETVLFGNSVTAKSEDAFAEELPDIYRFAGWATSRDGEVVYAAGETVPLEENADLFAKWDVAKTDVCGGGDKLFVSSKKGESGVVILCREGQEEKRGAVNGAGVFSFSGNGAVKLDGRIEGDVFYYYKDTLEKEYAAFDGSAAKMELKPHGEAVYTPADGEAVIGAYSLNTEDGSYQFTAGAGEQSFLFLLTEKSGAIVFRTVAAEAGYYALKTEEGYDYDLLYFDGLGGVTYFMRETEKIVEYGGTYALTDGGTKTYFVSLYTENGTKILDAAIRLESAEGALDDFALSGVYTVGDDFAGEYEVGDSWSGRDVFVLDGFGKGTKNGKAGSYTIEHTESWNAVENSYVYEVVASWVRFVTDEDGEVTELDFGEDLSTSVTVIEKDSLYGRYDVEGALFFGGKFYLDAFLLIDNNGSGKFGHLWVGSTQDDGTLVYAQADDGFVYASGDNYAFRSRETYAQKFFALTEGGKIRFTDVALTFFDGADGTLIVDGEGKAQFTPADGAAQEIEYYVEDGLLFVYTFLFADGNRSFVLEDVGYGDPVATEIEAENVFDFGYLTEDRRNNYTARLIRISEDKAILGLLLEDNRYYYCYYGTFGINATEDYAFLCTQSIFPENEYLDVYEEYGHFLFRVESKDGVNYFYQYDEAIDITCEAGTLVTDGYSVAEYTPVSGDKITGTYSYDGSLVYVTAGEAEYIFRVIDPAHFELVEEVGEEKGYYFTLTNDGDIGDYYFFLDGKGTVLLYYGSQTQWGVYETTGIQVLGRPEYRFTFTVTSEEGTQTLEYHVVIASLTVSGETVNIYIMREETQYGLYEIYKDGVKVGELDGNGYFDAYYIEGEELIASGVLTRCDVTDGDYRQPIDFLPSTEGSCVLFLETDEEGNVLAQYLFDLVDGKAVLRDLAYGAYGLYENGAETSDYMYLDGRGTAVRYNAKNERVDSGEYRAFAEAGENAYRYVSGDGEISFVFNLSVRNGRNYYSRYSKTEAYTDSNWAALLFDGFGGAVYLDRYGVRTAGDCIEMTDGLIAFRPYAKGDTVYFELKEDGTFRMLTDDWVIQNGTLYLYTGYLGVGATSLRIPDGVKTIAEGAFALADLDYLETLDLNEVTAIGANVFAGSGVTAISSRYLETIGAGAFKDTSLRTAEIPNVKAIGAEAFMNAPLVNVVLGGAVQIGANAFTRRATNTTVTVFDFTGIADFAAVGIDETAFLDSAGAAIAMKITVADLAAMNAVSATDWPEGVKAAACIANQAADNVNGTLYADLMTGNVYGFVNGKLLKDLLKNNTYSGDDTEECARYYVNADGNAALYSFADGRWTAGGELNVSDQTVAFGGVTLWKADDYRAHAFTDAENSDTLAFTLSLSRYESYYGLSITFNVAQVKLNGVSVSDVVYDKAAHKLTCSAENGTYEITLTGVGACTSVKTKELLRLEYVPAGTVDKTNPRFRITFGFAGGKTVIDKFEKSEKDTQYYSPELISSDATDGVTDVFTVVIKDGNYNETYTVTFRPASESDEASFSIVLEEKVASKTMGSTDYNWYLSYTYADGKLLGCTRFANWEAAIVDYTILGQVVNSDGTLDLTVEDDQGKTRTFHLKLNDSEQVIVKETTEEGPAEPSELTNVLSKDSQWRLTVGYLDEKLMNCTFFAYMEDLYSSPVEYEITETVANADGTLTLTAKDNQGAMRTFELKMTVEDGYWGVTRKIEVTETTEAAELSELTNVLSKDSQWRLTVGYLDEKLMNCTFFAYMEDLYSSPVEYEITETVANADGTLTLTAKDDQGATRTFELKMTVEDSYWGVTRKIEVTETTTR